MMSKTYFLLFLIPILFGCAQNNHIRKDMNKQSSSEQQQTMPQEILIKFESTVSTEQIKALQSELGLEFVKDIPQLNIKVFKITSPEKTSDILHSCEKKDYVKYAEINQKIKTQKQ